MSKHCTKIEIKKQGGIEVMQLVQSPIEKPLSHQVIVKNKASGINFIDIYHRNGTYPLQTPHGLGIEASGIVDEVGSEVMDFRSGDRVVFITTTPLSYAECSAVDAKLLCKVPDSISLNDIAATFMKGLTILSLFDYTTSIKNDSFVLFTGGSGGVGILACQYARHRNIKLIVTASTDQKCNYALKNGAHAAINYRNESISEKVNEITMGRGVQVVMDSIGKDTFESHVKLVQPLGTFISFGNSTGHIPPISMDFLAERGSIKITRATVFNYIKNQQRYTQMAESLFELLSNRSITAVINQTYQLKQIHQAHQDLENRKNTASSILEF